MANVFDNVARRFDEEIKMPFRQASIARKLIPKNKELSGAGIGHLHTESYKFRDVSPALTGYTLPEGEEDTIDIGVSTEDTVFIKKSYKIPRPVWESFQLKNMKVDSSMALAVSDIVRIAEEQLLLDGWKPDGSNYKVKGLYQLAGQTESTADDFGTYGKAKEKVSKAVALAEKKYIYGPYNLLLNPDQENELAASESSSGVEEWPKIIRMLNKNLPETQYVGTVYSSDVIATGTGMLLPVSNLRYFDLVIPQEPKNQLGEDSKEPETSPIFGSVYEAIALRVHDNNCLIKLTNI